MSALPDRLSVKDYRALLAAGTPAKVARRKNPEEDLHRACFAWVGLVTPRHPLLRWMVHVPNGGKRPRGEAGKLKAMGAKPGVPDLMLPRRCGDWAGVAIELKSPTGRVSDDQQEWLSALDEEGYLTAVCRTLDEFQSVVGIFLSGRATAASKIRTDQLRDKPRPSDLVA